MMQDDFYLLPGSSCKAPVIDILGAIVRFVRRMFCVILYNSTNCAFSNAHDLSFLLRLRPILSDRTVVLRFLPRSIIIFSDALLL